jgi:hypothetical protein
MVTNSTNGDKNSPNGVLVRYVSDIGLDSSTYSTWMEKSMKSYYRLTRTLLNSTNLQRMEFVHSQV